MNIPQVSVITGASKGIGFASAERLNSMGHQVIGLARSTPDKSFPGEFIEVDLSDRNLTDKVATDIASRYEVTHLINNLGLVRSEAIEGVDLRWFKCRSRSKFTSCGTAYRSIFACDEAK